MLAYSAGTSTEATGQKASQQHEAAALHRRLGRLRQALHLAQDPADVFEATTEYLQALADLVSPCLTATSAATSLAVSDASRQQHPAGEQGDAQLARMLCQALSEPATLQQQQHARPPPATPSQPTHSAASQPKAPVGSSSAHTQQPRNRLTLTRKRVDTTRCALQHSESLPPPMAAAGSEVAAAALSNSLARSISAVLPLHTHNLLQQDFELPLVDSTTPLPGLQDLQQGQVHQHQQAVLRQRLVQQLVLLKQQQQPGKPEEALQPQIKCKQSNDSATQQCWYEWQSQLQLQHTAAPLNPALQLEHQQHHMASEPKVWQPNMEQLERMALMSRLQKAMAVCAGRK